MRRVSNSRSITIHRPSAGPRMTSRQIATPAASHPTQDAIPTGTGLSGDSRTLIAWLVSSNIASPRTGPALA